MSPLQRIIFVFGAAVAISLASTVSVVLLERAFPHEPVLTIAGPFLCAGSALIFSKWYYGRL
jgi:hypothetical protein